MSPVSWTVWDRAHVRSIHPQAPLLSGYLTGLLCRNDKLSKQGRTITAIVLGLGDESADPTHNSTLLIYGQKIFPTDNTGPPRLRLCVGRRKAPVPPPSVRKVKPGEPLPRGTSTEKVEIRDYMNLG